MSESNTEHIRVWLVEDNEVFRRNVQRVINGLDEMTCDGSFDSAESTFAALQSNPAPDVILLDVQLPGVHGIAALSNPFAALGEALAPIGNPLAKAGKPIAGQGNTIASRQKPFAKLSKAFAGCGG